VSTDDVAREGRVHTSRVSIEEAVKVLIDGEASLERAVVAELSLEEGDVPLLQTIEGT
jgi:hypothetical protein